MNIPQKQTPPIKTCSSCQAVVESDYYIGENGNWFIYGKDTGKSSKGNNGDTPFIGTNGNWWVGKTDLGQPAQGIVNESGPQSASELF